MNLIRAFGDKAINPGKHAGLYDRKTGELVTPWNRLLITGCIDVSETKELHRGSNELLIRTLRGDLLIPDDVTAIAAETFSHCSSLTGVTIPESVMTIGAEAFKGCTNLTSVVLPEGITCIEDGVFEGCASLVTIELPESIRCIGQWSFGICTNLEEISIPSRVETIGASAFLYCTSLQSITMPYGVAIGSGAFINCCNLTEVCYEGESDAVSAEASYALQIAIGGRRSFTEDPRPAGVYDLDTRGLTVSWAELIFTDCLRVNNENELFLGANRVGLGALHGELVLPEWVVLSSEILFNDYRDLVIGPIEDEILTLDTTRIGAGRAGAGRAGAGTRLTALA